MSDRELCTSGESLELALVDFRDAVVKATLDAVEGVAIRTAFDTARLSRFGSLPSEKNCIRIREIRDAVVRSRATRSVCEGAQK